MKNLLVAASLVGVLLSPAGAWAGGYGHHHHHHHDNHRAEYLALGILGGVLGGIVLGHAISEHSYYPPRRAYVPSPVYYGAAYVPVCPPRRPCYR